MTYTVMPGMKVYEMVIGQYQQGGELPLPPGPFDITDEMVAAGEIVLGRYGAEGLTGFTVAEIYKAMAWEHHLQDLRAKGEKVSSDSIRDVDSGD